MFSNIPQQNVRVRSNELILRDTGLKRTCNFTPNINVPAIDTFILAVKNTVTKIRESENVRGRSPGNMSKA